METDVALNILKTGANGDELNAGKKGCSADAMQTDVPSPQPSLEVPRSRKRQKSPKSEAVSVEGSSRKTCLTLLVQMYPLAPRDRQPMVLRTGSGEILN